MRLGPQRADQLLASASDGSGLCFALRDDLDVAIGLDADDFTKNLRTALAEARGLPFVRPPVRVLAGDLTAGAAIPAVSARDDALLWKLAYQKVYKNKALRSDSPVAVLRGILY